MRREGVTESETSKRSAQSERSALFSNGKDARALAFVVHVKIIHWSWRAAESKKVFACGACSQALILCGENWDTSHHTEIASNQESSLSANVRSVCKLLQLLSHVGRRASFQQSTRGWSQEQHIAHPRCS